jgi:hypothetical protein
MGGHFGGYRLSQVEGEKMGRKSVNRWCAASVLAAFVLVSGGCKKQEEPGGISGTVVVEGGSAAGASVELYQMPTFDDVSVWTTARNNPAVWFPYSAQAAFDRRVEGARLRGSTTAGSDGSFSFPDMPEGSYVAVAFKDEFGWSRPVTVTLRGGNLPVGTLMLYPETHYAGGGLSEDTRWQAGRHYVIDRDLHVSANVTLTIEPGVVVRVGDQMKLQVGGTLVCEGTADSFIVFTSDLPNPQASSWQYVRFVSGAAAPLFRYCSFRFGSDGIYSTTPGAQVEYCYMADLVTVGINLTGDVAGGRPTILRHNVIDHIAQGIRLTQSRAELLIERNAIVNVTDYAMDLESITGGAVYCNWFRNCGRADTLPGQATGVIFLHDIHGMEIYRNDFQWSWYGLAVNSRVDSSVHIHHNNFTMMNRVVNLGVNPDRTGPGYPRFNYNCLTACTNFFIRNDACLVNTMPMDATNNYWGTLSQAAVRRQIYDYEDDPVCPVIQTDPLLASCPTGEVGLCPP